MNFMRSEILETAEAVRRCLRQSLAFKSVAARIRALDPPFVVVCARGSSSHAGTYLRALLGKDLGLTAAPAMPSISSVYKRPQHVRGALYVAISQSGRSPDLIAATHQARSDGALTLAIVNDTTSPLAAACELVLDLDAGPERSVAATKTVVTSMAAGLALVAAWREDPIALAALTALPDRLATAANLIWADLEAELATLDHIFVVGRGPALGVVSEAALKLTEVCGLPGFAYSTAEFVHGPMTLAGPKCPILAFVQDDMTRAGSEALLNSLVEREIPVLCAGGDVAGARPLPVMPSMYPDADLLTFLIPFYLAAEAAARARGRDPDRPRALSKVTMTI